MGHAREAQSGKDLDEKHQVSFRPMQAGDLGTIERAFELTWASPIGAGTPIGSLGTRYCVKHYQSISTRCEVAVKDNEILGVTMARVAGKPLAFPAAGKELNQIAQQMERDPAGKRLLDHTREWYRNELELERSAQLGEYANAELELFLVMSRARGLGVGGRMFNRVRDYFFACGAPGFFLHTDSDSDVGFYEHQGMRCVAKRSGVSNPDVLYIYVGTSHNA